MIISGNGQEIIVEAIGKNVRIEASAEFDRKDLSGQTSSSDVSAAGNKPKRINVSLQIKTEQSENLTKVLDMAEALDPDGNPVVYTVSSPLASAMRIRQAIFDGGVRIREDDTLLCYNVSFELKEMRSVPEKKEERERAKASDGAAATDGEIQVGSADHKKVVEAAAK